MLHSLKKIIIAAALLALGGARAEGVVLPRGLVEIDAEAFAGAASIRELTIPDSVRTIGSGAFSDCIGLCSIVIPENAEKLGEGILDGCPDDVLIQTSAGSAANAYAVANQHDYQADTVYRALLIGQTYSTLPSLALVGPENDVNALQSCISGFGGTAFQVSVRKNLTANGILNAIGNTFGSATAQDVSLLYYSGHGVFSNDDAKRGALLGSDGINTVTADQLRAALDEIPGRKIVIIDACYSGNMLNAGDAAAIAEEALTEIDFMSSFIEAFSGKARAGLAGENYFVLTSAAENEEAFENNVGGQVMGLFTASLVEGCGYDLGLREKAGLYADANSNAAITIAEIYQYTRPVLNAQGQHVQMYPSDCGWFGIFREIVS